MALSAEGTRKAQGATAVMAATFAYAIVFVAWVGFGWGGESRQATIADLGFLPVSLGGAAMAWLAARRSPRSKAAWRMLAAAFLAMWLGDATWAYVELVQHRDPFPSIADPLYLLFYPLALGGVLLFPAARRRRGEGFTFALDAATVLLGSGMVVWYFVLRPTVITTGTDTMSAVLSLAYPVGDLVLLLGIATALLRRPDYASRCCLRMMVAGMAVFVFADVGYGYLSVGDRYAAGDWPDAGWMIAQVLLMAAAWMQVRGDSGGDSHREHSSEHASFSVVPYMAVLLGYGLLFTVARPQSDTALGGLVLGAVALTVLVLTRQVRVMHENAQLMHELQALTRVDELTGLMTRRAFLELAEHEWARARRNGSPLCVVALDIDHFKSVNDRLGHSTGDTVLATVGERIRASLRASDIAGRLGGDEMIVLLPDATISDAHAAVERLRAAIEPPIATTRGGIAVTVSAGIAEMSDQQTALIELLEGADGALYRAKSAGRNAVRVASRVA